MTDLDKMARELLAAELSHDGWAGELAAALIADRPDDVRVPGNIALSVIRAALLTAPPGYVLVPVEPTRAMISAGHVYYQASMDEVDDFTPRGMFNAMLAAAPEVK